MKTLNIEELKSSILSRIKDETTNFFPQTVLIDNISFCNLKCTMCPHKSMKRKKGIMSWELYRKIIDEIAVKKLDSRVWVTFAGEGLILKDLPERIEYAKKKGLKDVVLNSNGNLLNNVISEKLIKAGLNAIYVGIDAHSRETYEKTRVGGNMENVIQGVIEYFNLLKKDGTSEQKIYVQFVVQDENEREVDHFISFWNSKGISVKVRPKASWAGKVNANNLHDFLERLPCYWAMNTINIIDDGRVSLCAIDLECEGYMGDINHQTIEEVWNGKLKEFRLNQLKGEWNKIPSICSNCKDWQTGYADFSEKK